MRNQLLLLGLGIASFTILRGQPAGLSGTAPVASWGYATAYSTAAAADSSLRPVRSASFNGYSGEVPLSDDSPRQGFYPHCPQQPIGTSVHNADVIAVGTVLKGASYLSTDHTTIYTEMPVRVDHIISNKSLVSINPSSQVTVQRVGGVVIASSGKHLIRGCPTQAIPRRGQQYVLFLQYSPALGAFNLTSAFQLALDHVYSLDAVFKSGGQFVLNDMGSTQSAFLQQVQTLVSH